MLALLLAGWTALGGAGNGKLSEGWVAFCQGCQKATPAVQEIDWVQYYKTQGYDIKGSPYGPGRINSSPVFVSPTLQWAVPNHLLNGPPVPPYGSQYGPEH